MWVWSDELVERVQAGGADRVDQVPLTAYSVVSETDLDELALEVFSGMSGATADLSGAARAGVDR